MVLGVVGCELRVAGIWGVEEVMEIQQIRNATLRITYAGRLFLTDPMLSQKHEFDSFAGISPNPISDLPIPAQDVVDGIEMVLLSHLHIDHFDPAAQDMLSKDMPILCQPGDEERLRKKGFHSVTPVDQVTEWQGIKLTRTQGRHGTGTWAEKMGNVSGYVLQAESEPTLYWAGDTILCDEVRQVVTDIQPDIILTHSSGAKLSKSDPIVMDAEQTIALCRAAPKAIVVATHMEALDHGTISRADLRALAEREGIGADRLFIPVDGKVLRF